MDLEEGGQQSHFISQRYSLSISNLTLNDAGSYKSQINQRNFEVTTEEEFTLFIYGEFQRASVF